MPSALLLYVERDASMADPKGSTQKASLNQLVRLTGLRQTQNTSQGRQVLSPDVRNRTILLGTLIQSYLQEAETNHRSFRSDLNHANYWTQIFGDIPIDELTPADLEKWKADRLVARNPRDCQPRAGLAQASLQRGYPRRESGEEPGQGDQAAPSQQRPGPLSQ